MDDGVFDIYFFRIYDFIFVIAVKKFRDTGSGLVTLAALGLWRENYDAYPLCCRPTNAMGRQPSWWTRR